MNGTPLDPDDIGEQLKALFAPPSSEDLSAVGADDCAAISIPSTTLVLTSDFVNAAPIGLELGISSQEDLGYYLVASNISDLAGSGARPLGLLINVMWSRGENSSAFWELMEGVKNASIAYGAPVLGGDTKLTTGKTVLNAVAFGMAESTNSMFLQGRAKVGQSIWVSGDLGSCAAAVIGIDVGLKDPDWLAWAELAVRRPVVPLGKSRAIASLQLCAAGIDLSDGLGADLARMAKESGVGVQIDLDSVPVAPELAVVARSVGVHPGSFALTIGGDLQFAVTTPRGVSLHKLGMTQIGEVVAPTATSLVVGGRKFTMPGRGHRDAHGLSFVEEVKLLMRELPFNDH